MNPFDELPRKSVLELTPNWKELAPKPYSKLEVDLTAWLAMHEPDPYVKSCLDFALLEDFDHLYRYSNLMNFDSDIPAHKLTLDLVEITPGRDLYQEIAMVEEDHVTHYGSRSHCRQH